MIEEDDCSECHGAGGRYDEEVQDQWYWCHAEGCKAAEAGIKEQQEKYEARKPYVVRYNEFDLQKAIEKERLECMKTVEEQIKEAVAKERARCEAIAQHCRSNSDSDMRTVISWVRSGDWPDDDEEDG